MSNYLSHKCIQHLQIYHDHLSLSSATEESSKLALLQQQQQQQHIKNAE